MPTWLAVIGVTATVSGSVGFCSWVVVQIMGLKARVAAIEKTCRERQSDRRETRSSKCRLRFKNFAVRERLEARSVDRGPATTTSPPSWPAPGPKSTM